MCVQRSLHCGPQTRFSSTTAFVVPTKPPTVKMTLSTTPNRLQNEDWSSTVNCSFHTQFSKTTDNFKDAYLCVLAKCACTATNVMPVRLSFATNRSVEDAGSAGLSSTVGAELDDAECRGKGLPPHARETGELVVRVKPWAFCPPSPHSDAAT